jgi:hypothetical protein
VTASSSFHVSSAPSALARAARPGVDHDTLRVVLVVTAAGEPSQ